MSVLVAFSVTPLGVGENVGEIVAEAVRVVRESGLANRADAMFTLVDGEGWDEVMDVVKHAVEAVGRHAPTGEHRGEGGLAAEVTDAMTGKVESVEPHLGAPATG